MKLELIIFIIIGANANCCRFQLKSTIANYFNYFYKKSNQNIMKNLLLISSLLLCFNFLNAQEDDSSPTDAGTWFLNGQSSLNIVFSDGTPVILGIGAGYFVINKLMTGINFNYIRFRGISDSRVALMARYYAFSDAYIGGNLTLTDERNFSLIAGYSIFLNKTVALDLAFTYPFQEFVDPSLSMSVSVFL